MNDSPREFDIVVVGATGFTGALVAEYLCERYGVGADLRWAVAARSQQKLSVLQESLGSPAASLPVIVADTLDAESMRDLARRTRVVLTTVGPYARYGSELVAACAESGTHYCDLAGEVQWIRRMIDAHDATARKSGARIVEDYRGIDVLSVYAPVNFGGQPWILLAEIDKEEAVGTERSWIAIAAGILAGLLAMGLAYLLWHVLRSAPEAASP